MTEQPPLFRGQGVRIAGFCVGIAIALVPLLVVFLVLRDDVPAFVPLTVVAIAVVVAAIALVLGLVLGRKVFGQRLELAMRPVGSRDGSTASSMRALA